MNPHYGDNTGLMPMPAKIQENLSLKKSPPPSPSAEKALNRLRGMKGNHQIAVGLSGGVDSSLTAALFVAAGWKINGLTLWLLSGKGSCCSDGLIDAAGICSELGIPHHVVDSR